MANMNKNNTNRGGLEANPSPWDEISGIEPDEDQKIHHEVDQYAVDSMVGHRAARRLEDEADRLLYKTSEAKGITVDDARHDWDYIAKLVKADEAKNKAVESDKQALADLVPQVQEETIDRIGLFDLSREERQKLAELGDGSVERGAAMRAIELSNRLDKLWEGSRRILAGRVAEGAFAGIRNMIWDLTMSKEDKYYRKQLRDAEYDTWIEYSKLVKHPEHVASDELTDEDKRRQKGLVKLSMATEAYSNILSHDAKYRDQHMPSSPKVAEWMAQGQTVSQPIVRLNSWQAVLDDWYDEKKEAEEKGNTADK